MPTRKVLADPDLRQQVLDRLDNTLAEAQRTIDAYAYLIGDMREVASAIGAARGGIIKARLSKAANPPARNHSARTTAAR